MTYIIHVYIYLILVSQFKDTIGEDKRLLLNDADTLQLLHQLQTIVTQQTKEIQNLQNSYQEITQQLKQVSMKSGSTYTVWGRKSCSPSSDTIYSGYTGGGLYTDTGAAAEALCLPSDPIFNRTSITPGAGHGRIYGSEYLGQHFFSQNGEDIPCSVCHSASSASVLMIPGRNACYPGWNMEYYGYLASGDSADKAASSYICIHINAENLNGGEQRIYGKHLYPVVAKCLPLQCPPYHNNYPLTCVVCTK